MKEDRLFTPLFFTMCGYSFTVFLSALQLFPTAPFRIIELGGDRFAAGLFLGFLTYASAWSAPLTGAVADRVGRRRTLIVCSLSMAVFAAGYAYSTSYHLMLAIAVVHGVFWSGLLSASSAYLTELVPATRRAEGIGYWGLASVFATAFAPTLGLWVFHFGWLYVCLSVFVLALAMAGVAFTLEDDRKTRGMDAAPRARGTLVEWRVIFVAVTLFMYSFGYGGVMSFAALYADANGVAPRGLYFTCFALTIVASRPFSLRLADRVGHARIFLPCLTLVVVAYALLAVGGTLPYLVASAVIFGAGFGNAYPMFAAMVTHEVAPERRGAAFGGIIAAFDTGIGTGSITAGWIIEHYGFRPAWTLAASLALFSVPYFLLVAPRLLPSSVGRRP